MAESHWKLGRRKQRGLPETAEAAAAEQAVAVGEILRRHREERGLDLRQIAESLHIRLHYLQAIENSLVDELPGPTYALGFVKAYAEHLGLDSDTVVERFKAQMLGLNSKTELVFPSPLPEGKVPSAAILIVAAMLAVAAYSGWMYFSDGEQQVAEVVPPLPEKVRELAERQKGDADTPAETTKTPQIAAKPAEASPPAANPAPELPTEQGSAEGDAPEAAPENPAETKPVENSPAKIAAAPLASAPVPDQPAATPEAEAQPTPEPAPAPAFAADREPKVYGDESGQGRIVMRAVGATWVEIRDESKNEVLLTRVLYSGDRYFLPNRDGLVLLTGNAGGIEISVDGAKVPAIGPKGAVRRNVLLDPVALKEGRAVQDTPAVAPQQSDATVKPAQ